MADMISIKEAAVLWNITERRVTALCKQGRIKGAAKNGRSWEIPADAKKPNDNRIKTGSYKRSIRPGHLPLPVGVSDYRVASEEYYYVDKTLLIKDFLDEKAKVSLFTRPRRFGKTLNMDMLCTFFEKTKEDTSIYFKNKKIWSCGQKYRNYQGKYPVIFITFKDVKRDTWKETLAHVGSILKGEFERHRELLSSDQCSEYEKAYFKTILEGKADTTELMTSLQLLSQMLDEHYNIAPIIIIDEYDTPIQQGHNKGFYDDVILFMRNLFSGGLKDNKHLSYGFLTGILRVAKESIFSGLNNLKINSILDNKYSEYFGFTPDEVREMARYYHAEDKFEEICKWYDGYQFGSHDIFNPWSVINYFSNSCQPRAFWQSTGSNDIIGEVLTGAGKDVYKKLAALLRGDTVPAYIDTSVIYPQVKNNPSSIYSFLLVTGYLKAVKSELSFNGDFMCEVALPNREISIVYRKEVLEKMDEIFPPSTVIAIQESLYSGNADELKLQLHSLLLQSTSFYDTVGENFYHGFLLGLCAVMEQYLVNSNGESGDGRFDIELMPKSTKYPGILMELKAKKDCGEKELKALSQNALRQIHEKKYDMKLIAAGVKKILKYGVAFSGKNVEISVE